MPNNLSCYTRNSLRNTRATQLKSNRYPFKSIYSHDDSSDAMNEVDEEEDVSKATLIWRAIKLPIYTVALIPVSVGGAAAFLQTGMFSAARYFLLFASFACIIAWLNLSNDVFDFDTGADKKKKESVVNLTGCRRGTLMAANSVLFVGFVLITWTSFQTGTICAILLISCTIAFGYIYQGPPFRLSYHGLGEPLCFFASGPFATTAFYLIQGSTSEISAPITGPVVASSLLVGFTTSLILFCSHFHQIEGDLAVRKMSPLVRIGTERGAKVVKLAIVTLYVLVFAFALSRILPLTCIILCVLTMPMENILVTFVQENHKDKQKIFMAKYYCVRLHTLFGAALAVGLVLARKFSTNICSIPSLRSGC